ncbi:MULTISPECIES: hypothetical protein [Bacillaceae]|uniref:Uncharacterized protein n=1 Tax=Evansella alkalicola TaxID=745819 RepID=A0ABS6JW31_9BACI|nr:MULTISPECIES: hypothetical protein [Bacillaceae]MBU9721452.1 hypothetical protein [Bacillus alkalicola]
MLIENGTEYDISEEVKKNFFFSDMLIISGKNGNTIRFKLSNGKGYGSMPLQHMEYMIRKGHISERLSNRQLREEIKQGKGQHEDQIG